MNKVTKRKRILVRNKTIVWTEASYPAGNDRMDNMKPAESMWLRI